MSRINSIKKLLNKYLAEDDPEDSLVPQNSFDFKLYFIQERPSKNIKIGISQKPHKRLLALQTGTSQKLVLLWYVAIDKRQESVIHKYLHKDRIRGEWFKPTERVLYFLLETICHCFDGTSYLTTPLLGELDGYR